MAEGRSLLGTRAWGALREETAGVSPKSDVVRARTVGGDDVIAFFLGELVGAAAMGEMR